MVRGLFLEKCLLLSLLDNELLAAQPGTVEHARKKRTRVHSPTYARTCTLMYAYPACMHAHIYNDVQPGKNNRICAQTHAHTPKCTHTSANTRKRTHAHTRANASSHKRTHAHAQTHTHSHAQAHAHTRLLYTVKNIFVNLTVLPGSPSNRQH